ncbi:J domain-containing protein [Litchfieldia alkalitelluris]|uniref:J domain-containing protein n=1 Tax=Litchfieldia alkalitelluris TaxID=304268 RepID=UPI000998CBE4|nr:J domain-containing protein [Litchfieldia alkalitelluris]
MQLTSTDNYYKILEIEPSASLSEIRKAYYSKIRQYSNESHPEEFKLITKAYRTLVDPELKKQYDLETQDDGSYQKLLNHVLAAMDKEQYKNALLVLDQMQRKYPQDAQVLHYTALCHMNLSQYELSKNVLLRLEAIMPDNEDVLKMLGRSYLELNMKPISLRYYKKVMELYPNEVNNYINVATVYLNLEQYDQALSTLESKFKNGREMIYDFPILIEIFDITMLLDRKSYFNKTILRIKKLYETDEEKRILLNMLMQYTESVNNDYNGFKALIKMIKEINKNSIQDVNEWIREAESHIRSDLIYYGDHVPNNTHSTNNQNYSHSNTTTNVPVEVVDPERGSILFAIILGIIASFFLTPIGGIIVGFIWYFNAEKIKEILSCLGCLIVVIIAFMILTNL